MWKMLLFLTLAFSVLACADNGPCADGTKLRGGAPPKDTEQWCEKVDDFGDTIRVGPYSAWFANGTKQAVGQYNWAARATR